MGRGLYSALLYLLSPFIWWRIWREWLPTYKRRQRLGWISRAPHRPLWIHAASVGEIMTARPLIKALIDRYPDSPVVVTTMTATGAEQVKTLFKGEVSHYFLPLDFPCATARFVERLSPRIGIIVETELWPNLVHACARRQVPLALVNGRLSAGATRQYAKVARLMAQTLNHFDWLGIKDAVDAERFTALGAPTEKMVITGGLKFDLAQSDEAQKASEYLLDQWGGRFVWVAASTHDGEDEQVLAAHRRLLAVVPSALLVLVPRHPQRFDDVAQLVSHHGLAMARRSRGEGVTPDIRVYLGDTMGEVMTFYGTASAAFVGGSLVPVGGHNLLEPASLGVPVISGPYLDNFTEIAALLDDADALTHVSSSEHLGQALLAVRADPATAHAQGARGQDVVVAHRGALAATLDGLIPLLPQEAV
ncbi:lipid IV(A) 3-deoxy-D-manno-octulosonic acid transferase [Larsenimonas rhizosphaerae]|uniref:lipid IV(A) 3-deoxy-D-manno-octulosonic acid transferase n=1 Tax=Larsenimonas rhizosphaerae TaxID=2944682 RepID=UPI00203371AD|nr:lipid IV(A) 3-deoxy-D-manno-octulosonic acid transferase [Larsenimonas rhizosphaerae]MCM2129329.1 lipid IV(A) 3-deoxy-D-manno-octulosonic acid transferase [Larsenimonas rhizosphaerae]